MRRFALPAASLAGFLALIGCDTATSSSSPSAGGALQASPAPNYISPADAVKLSQGGPSASLPKSTPTVSGLDPAPSVGGDAEVKGRALFDGAKADGGAAGGDGAVKAGGAFGPSKGKASPNASAKKDTLKINAVPPPGANPSPDAAVLAKAAPDGGLPGNPGLNGSASLGQPGAKGGSSAAVSSCPGDMVGFGSFCMDKFEFPNQLAALPLAAETALEGEAKCGAIGKRLCSEDEWEGACRAGTNRRLPYGDRYEKSLCNDDKTWKTVNDSDWTKFNNRDVAAAKAHAATFYQADPSGSRKQCVTPEGVYDLLGNVAEWTTARPGGRPYAHVMKGGFWSGAWLTRSFSCSLTNAGHPGHFRSYEAGFRCCVSLAKS